MSQHDTRLRNAALLERPIRPDDVAETRAADLPVAVLRVFNTLIASHWEESRGRSRFTQEEAVGALSAALLLPRTEVFSRHLLDVEAAYRAEGWDVDYDKPGFNETYEATFTFRALRGPTR